MLTPSRGIVVIACAIFVAMIPSISSAADAPTVTSISPDEAANFQPTSVTISGSNFSPTPTGRLNNVWLEDVTFISSTMLTATVPAHLPAGNYALTIMNPDAQTATLSNAVTIVASSNGSLSPWYVVSEMNKPRSALGTALWNDYVYAAGGWNQIDGEMSSVEYARVNSFGVMSWQLTSSMTTARLHFALVAHRGHLYAIGGSYTNSVERAAINSAGSLGPWQADSPMVVERIAGAAVAWGDYLYALGGLAAHGSIVNSSVERAFINSDGSLGSWELISTMDTPRTDFAAVIAGDYIFTLGGLVTTSATPSVSRAHINSNGTLGPWQSVNPLNKERRFFAATTAAGTIYAIGGITDGLVGLASVEKATVDASGSLSPWRYTSPLTKGTLEFGALAAGGYLYAIGGSATPIGTYKSVERAPVIISPPSLSSFSPQAVPASSSTMVTGTGAGLLPPVTLRLGDSTPVTASWVSSTTLTIIIPSGLAGGWYTATLTNPDGQETALTNALLVDGDAPTGTIVVNAGQTFANNRSVNLSLSASDVGSGLTQMSFSNDGATWAEWQGYAITASWSLPTGDGTKTVYARFRDQAGNISATASDDIILDTQGPSASVMPLSTYQASHAFTVAWYGSDTTSGVSHYDVQRRDGATGTWTDWQVAVVHTTSDFTGQDGHTYYFRVRAQDNAGNLGPFSSGDTQTTVDVTPPTGSITILSGGGANEQSTSVVLGLTAIDAVSGVGSMMLSNDPSFAGAKWESFATTRTWTLGSGNTVYVRFRDNAGNVSQTYSAEWRLMLPLLVR